MDGYSYRNTLLTWFLDCKLNGIPDICRHLPHTRVERVVFADGASGRGNVCMQNAFPCSDAGTARNGSSLLLRHSLLPSPPTSHRHHIFSTSTDPSNMYYSPSGEKCLAKRIPNTPSGTSLLFPSFWGSEAKTAEEITQWLGSSPAPFRFRGPNGIMVFLSTLELVDRIFAISVARLIRDSKENYLPDEVEMAGNYVLMNQPTPFGLSTTPNQPDVGSSVAPWNPFMSLTGSSTALATASPTAAPESESAVNTTSTQHSSGARASRIRNKKTRKAGVVARQTRSTGLLTQGPVTRSAARKAKLVLVQLGQTNRMEKQ